VDQSVRLEQNRAIARAIFERGVTLGEADQIADLTGEDFLDHDIHVETGLPGGPDDMRQAILDIRTGFPDVQVTVHQTVAEGDLVVTRNTWEGTHLGVFNGMAPTGRRISIDGIVIWRISGGKIRERWATIDTLALLRQLGQLG
jgi:steroid delta-isomerase-like uncharacterized protein